MALPVVQTSFVSPTASNSTTTQTATGTVIAAAGSKLVAAVIVNQADTIDLVTSNVGGDFTQVGTSLCTEGSVNMRLSIWELASPAAGSHTITATRSTASASARFLMIVTQVSGASSTLSVKNTGTTPTADSASFSDSLTTTVSDTLVLGVCAAGGATSGSTTAVTPGTGQTTVASLIPGSTVVALTVSKQDAPTPGVQNASWTWDVSQRRASTFMLAIAPTVAGADTTPDAFTFTDRTNVPRNSVITGSAITVSGITGPATVALSGSPTTKVSINGGVATASPGTVSNGDTVAPVVTSSNSFNTAVTGTVTIGGVSDDFSVTTALSESFTFTITVTDALGATSALTTSIAVGPTGVIIPAPNPIQYGLTAGYNAGTTFDYYVSPSGNDSTGTGAIGSPFATISKALTVIGTTPNKSIGLRAGKHYAHNLALAAVGTRIAAYNGEAATISGGLPVTGWTQCTSGDSALLGSGYANIYKSAPISTAGWGHAAYNALIPIENGQMLNLVQNRRDTSDLFEQSDDSTFYRYTLSDGSVGDHTIAFTTSGTAASGSTLTLTHPSVLGTYTDTQLSKMAVMLLADPNVPTVLKVASASGGVLTFDTNTAFPDFSPSGGAYALLNNLKDLAVGQWGWVDNNDGTITLYVRPNNPANLAAGIDIAAYDRIFTINAGGCKIDGNILQTWADDASGSAGIVINNVAGCTVTENTLQFYSHQQKGYGSIYGLGGDGYNIYKNKIQWGQNQYGFFLAQGTTSGGTNHRVHNNYIYRTSQTGPRFYGQRFTAFYENWMNSCGVAAHANKINWYNGSDFCVTMRNKWTNCGGYATQQQASRILWLMNLIPMGPSATDTSRAFDDQTSTVQPPTDPSENYFIKNLLPTAGLNVMTGTEVAAQFIPDRTTTSTTPVTWDQNWNVIGNVMAGASYDSRYLTTTDYNTLTYGAAQGPNDVVVSETTLFADVVNENYATPAGSQLLTSTCPDLTSIINIYRSVFTDVDFDHDIDGNVVDWTNPGRGPWARGKWPIAS